MIVFIIMITKYYCIRYITTNTYIQYYIPSFKRFIGHNRISSKNYTIRMFCIQHFIHSIQCYLRIGLIIVFIMNIGKLNDFKISIFTKFQCLWLCPN